MLASLIGALRVSLSADTAAFASGMKRAERQAATSATVIQRSLGGIASGIGKLTAIGATLGIAFGAAAFVGAAKSALKYAASLGELSQQLGITVEQYQILERAAITNGTSMEAFGVGLKRLGKTLGDAQRGSKQAIEAFAAVGIKPEQLASMHQAGDAIRPLMEGIRKLGDGSLQASAATKLMGKSAQDLLPVLTQGAAGYDAMTAAALKSGLITAEQADKADAANDAIDLLAKTLETKLAVALLNNLPAINSVIDGLSDLIDRAATAIAWLGRVKTGEAVAESQIQLGARGVQRRVLVGMGLKSPGQANAEEQADISRTRGQIAGINAAGAVTPIKIARPARTTTAGSTTSLAGPGPKAKKAKSGESARKKALRDDYEAETDQRRADIDILRAKQDLTGDYVERTALQIKILDKEKEQEDAARALAVGLGDMTRTQADEIAAKQATLDGLKRQVVLQEQEDRRLEDVDKTEKVRADIARERLDGLSQLAETESERRKIELEILAAAYAERKAALERAMAATRDDQEKERLRQQISALPAQQRIDTANVVRGTRGPMESFIASLPTTAAKANEALESIASNGLQSLTDGLTDAIMGAKSLGQVFSAVAKQIIADLVKIAIERNVVGPLANALGKGLGLAIGGGGISKSSTTGGTGGLKGFASGGSFRIAGNSGVDRNILSVNGLPIARVGMGERIHVDPKNDNSRGGVIVHVHQDNNFAGGAATMEDVVKVAAVTKQATIGAIRELRRRNAF